MAAPVLAQINIARARFSLDAPEMAGFFERVAAVNAIAERTDGFVWRLAAENPGDTTAEVFGDPRLVVNLTMWASIDALRCFVRRTAHAKVMNRREEWFERLDRAYLAMWWQAPEEPPTLALGKRKLEALDRCGPTSAAFTFDSPFDAFQVRVAASADMLAPEAHIRQNETQ